jgi:hypothetical protein
VTTLVLAFPATIPAMSASESVAARPPAGVTAAGRMLVGPCRLPGRPMPTPITLPTISVIASALVRHRFQIL